MIQSKNSSKNLYFAVHPLDDQPEQKCGGALLEPMAMSRPVRASLFVLRTYLLAMVGLVAYRVLELTLLAHR